MVKIKAGYVMNAREQAEYERVNALPRKASGTAAYYFKPQTKYPPRIYVFMHAEIWCDRNRRPMGLHTAFPFLTRPMNREEIEYHHFDIRLCYHQYEDWGRLLYAEEKEAAQLDSEQAGTGAAFIESLRSFQGKYPLGQSVVHKAVPVAKPSANGEVAELTKLMEKRGQLSAAEIGDLLEQEQKGDKRTTLLILLREMYKMAAGAPNRLEDLTTQKLQRQAEISQERRRKNFVRRVFRADPLFALEEIRKRYPDYDQNCLDKDLKRQPPKPKRAKTKPVLDLRRVQLQKLAAQLAQAVGDPVTYHQICTRMAILEEAHRNRCAIPIAVKLQGRTEVYYFHWKTRETVVKAFVAFANASGQTHEVLRERHGEISSGNYSF